MYLKLLNIKGVKNVWTHSNTFLELGNENSLYVLGTFWKGYICWTSFIKATTMCYLLFIVKPKFALRISVTV